METIWSKESTGSPVSIGVQSLWFMPPSSVVTNIWPSDVAAYIVFGLDGAMAMAVMYWSLRPDDSTWLIADHEELAVGRFVDLVRAHQHALRIGRVHDEGLLRGVAQRCSR